MHCVDLACVDLVQLLLTVKCVCRNVDDACLESIAQFCPDMEQLDVLGTNRITPEGVERYRVCTMYILYQ